MDWWLKSYLTGDRFELPERNQAVYWGGKPLTLIGEKIQVARPAPFFRGINPDLEEVSLDDFKGIPLVIASVPSLHNSVCSQEAKRLERISQEIGAQAIFILLSMDLPFAQADWIKEAQAKYINLISDHRDAVFGYRYGVLIKELRLLARAIFVIDREGLVCYRQVLREISDEPDYDRALLALRNISIS